MNIPLAPYAPENLVLRDGISRPFPRQPSQFSILRLNLVLTHGILPDFAAASIIYLNHHTPPGRS